MIRLATVDDIPEIVRIGELMAEEGRYSHIKYNHDKVSRLAYHYITSDRNLLSLSEIDGEIAGFFWGYVSEFNFSNSLMAGEEFWYMLPERRGCRDGIELIKHFAEWAEPFGVVELSAGISLGVNNDKAGRVLMALGFNRSGEGYKRVL